MSLHMGLEMRNNYTFQMNLVMMLSMVLLLSFVQVDARERGNFIPLEKGVSRSKKDLLEVIMTNHICNSCLDVARKCEEILVEQNLSDEIDAISNTICYEASSSLEIKGCLHMARRYLHQAPLCLQIFFLGENLCKGIVLKPKISRVFLPSKLFTLESGERILREMLKKLIISTLKHKEYKSCAPCRNAMEDIHNVVGDAERQIMIIKLLHRLCDVSETHAAQCKKMVLVYGPLLLGNVQKMVTENDLCYMANLCKDPLPPPSPPSPPPPSKEEDIHYGFA